MFRGSALLRGTLATKLLVSASDVSGLAAYDMAADDTYLYVGSANGGGVVAYAHDLSSRTPLSGARGVFRIAVDGQGVYWGDHGNGAGDPNAGPVWMLVKKK